ncbi:hypothetical protein [Pseudomonas aeruginosa]|uniref:hypothetical protein n=1 Tax=Pseudomonas aeruginosa TaxID=287 RepID=UPI0015FBD864|nr:hypothetical protein [Pseudomonas aeruginosa]MBA6427031.1 hypothetical protein [Pseudomonas aeruginosa]MDU9380411.1 hypothetical protein [Pseudomonas aeruginosa]MDU9384674.1 hypothetical protein [Pseudomonas aeruginosa]
MSMEMNKANECTCPSGDGSLVHPCPAHPVVEQAGGDERAGFEAWLAQVMSHHFSPEFDLAKYEDSGEYRYNQAADYWKAWQARAALEQPSPCIHDKMRSARSASIESLRSLSHEELVERAEKNAQLYPAQAEQAEAERPIVSFEKYMQVMYDRDENAKRLDAALARIAELEAKLSDPTAVHQWQFSNAWFDGSEEVVLKAGKEGSPIRTLYAAPVAQAQHSAPDVCDGKEQDAFEEWASKEGMNMERHPLHWLFLDAKTYSARQGWKAALKYARNMLAAAPVCRLSRSALTEAQMRRLYENSTETENERLGFEAFARLIRRAEAVHQIAAAPAQGGE